MTKSFILIEVDEDLKEATKEAIRKHPAVSGIYTVVGRSDNESVIYDIVVKVEADTRRDLDDAEYEIRTRKEIRSTLTLEVIEKEDTASRSKDMFLQT
jgi:DNA-binding Lrp family transcriptional regulator